MQRPPASGEKHAHLSSLPRSGRAIGGGELLRGLGQQGIRGEASQVLANPVVWKALHLVVGKRHGEECVRFSRRARSAELLPCARGAGCPMMPVSDVKRGNRRKR